MTNKAYLRGLRFVFGTDRMIRTGTCPRNVGGPELPRVGLATLEGLRPSATLKIFPAGADKQHHKAVGSKERGP